MHWGRKLLEKILPNDITLGTCSKPETDENQDITLGMDIGQYGGNFYIYFVLFLLGFISNTYLFHSAPTTYELVQIHSSISLLKSAITKVQNEVFCDLWIQEGKINC